MPQPSGLRPAGSAIRARRCDLGLAEHELATRVGVSRPHMANVENSRRRVSLDVLRRIARELDMELEETIEAPGDRPPPRPPGPTHPRPTRPPRGDIEAVAS